MARREVIHQSCVRSVDEDRVAAAGQDTHGRQSRDGRRRMWEDGTAGWCLCTLQRWGIFWGSGSGQKERMGHPSQEGPDTQRDGYRRAGRWDDG